MIDQVDIFTIEEIEQIVYTIPYFCGFWPALVGGILGVGKAIVSAKGAKDAGKQNRDAAAEAQLKQIEFEREKAQNYHQWEVADLRAAGLNPILSATGGTPLGNVGAPFGVQENVGAAAVEGFQGGLGSAMQYAQMKMQKDQIQMQKEVAESQKLVNEAAAEKIGAETDTLRQESEAGIVQLRAQEMASNIKKNNATAAQMRQATDNLMKEGIILVHQAEKALEEIKNLRAYRDKLRADTSDAFSRVALNRANTRLAFLEGDLKGKLIDSAVIRNSLDLLDYKFRNTDYGRNYGRSYNELLSGVGKFAHDVLVDFEAAVGERVSGFGRSLGSGYRKLLNIRNIKFDVPSGPSGMP